MRSDAKRAPSIFKPNNKQFELAMHLNSYSMTAFKYEILFGILILLLFFRFGSVLLEFPIPSNRARLMFRANFLFAEPQLQPECIYRQRSPVTRVKLH